MDSRIHLSSSKIAGGISLGRLSADKNPDQVGFDAAEAIAKYFCEVGSVRASPLRKLAFIKWQ
jgi:hypothetical protein